MSMIASTKKMEKKKQWQHKLCTLTDEHDCVGKKKWRKKTMVTQGPLHLTYNPSYSACFFSRNSIFLS
jgi:hypothetical protein